MALNVPAGAREAHPQKESFILILLARDGRRSGVLLMPRGQAAIGAKPFWNRRKQARPEAFAGHPLARATLRERGA
jgi:hypothetical protein